MDPLSATASILAVLGVGGQAAKAVQKLSSIKDAPTIMLRLNNELSDLHILTAATRDVFQTVQASGIPPSINANIISTLNLVRDKLVELEALYNRVKSASPTSNSNTMSIKKSAWLAERKHLKTLQEDLRCARLKLSTVLSFLNSSSLTGIKTEMSHLQTKVEGLCNEVQNIKTTSKQATSGQKSAIESLEQRMFCLQTFQQQSLATQNRSLTQHTNRLITSTTQLLAAQQNIQIRLDTLQAAAVLRAAQDLATSSAQPPSPKTATSPQTILVPASLVRWKCSSYCSCACHRRYTAKSPQLLNLFFGMLFGGYVGLPMVTPPCDVRSCNQRAHPAVMAVYSFPHWLLARVVYLSVKLSTYEGPQFSLRISRVIDGASNVFHFIEYDRIDELKEVLRQRTFSPFDISHNTGFSILMYAAYWCKPAVCEILLSVGADPFQEHHVRGNTFDIALDTVLRKGGDDVSRQRLSALFLNDESLETSGLTLLHQTVIGLNELELNKLVDSIPRVAINALDRHGRTALWWAARRGDFPAVSTLIRAHADVNKTGPLGGRPLDAAIISGNEACVWSLLETDSIECGYSTRTGWTALHFSSFFGSSGDIVQKLIQNGADIDGLSDGDGFDAPALNFAVQEGHTHLVEILISHGASLDIVSLIGESALSLALKACKSQTLQLLLTREANYRQLIHVDETLLHHAAIFANFECLQTLCAFRLSGIDVDARTTGYSGYHDNEKVQGRTALEIATQREDVTPDWLEMFKLLVRRIDSQGVNDVARDGCEELEVFEDALEHQA